MEKEKFTNPPQQFNPPITFESIENDYEQYGYLEDYQVKWLLSEFKKLRGSQDEG